MANLEQSDQKGKPSKQKVDLDTILVEELGQFGWYQLRTLGLAVVTVLFMAWASTEYIFTTGRINTRCLIPGCDPVDETPMFAPSWVLHAVPGTSQDSFEGCLRFVNTTVIDDDTCPDHHFDRDTTVSCQEYVYESTHTVVYDYGLACEEWRRSLIGTVRTSGVLLATPLTGYISDRWGRRTALVINSINTCWLGLVRYFADTYVGFVISEFAEAVFGSGGFSSVYILFMEVVGPKYRVAGGATINTLFSIGQVTMGLIAWCVPYWRHLTLTLYGPQVIAVAYWWFMMESVRWYMSKGRYEDSEKALKEIARINGTKLSENSLRLLRQTAEEEKKKQALERAQKEYEPWLIVQVFQQKSILLRVCVSPVWWIANTFIYYGLSINAVNMSGNQYINYAAVSAAEIPGYWFAVFLMGKIGRKPVLIGAFWICALCQVGYIFLPSDMYELSLTLYLIGKLSIAMVMTTVYVYTSELYPTKYRHNLFAFSSMMGRIGAMIAPLTPAFGDSAGWDDLPFALFGGFALLSGALVFLTPETLGSKLPDTMEEAIRLGKGKKTRSGSTTSL